MNGAELVGLLVSAALLVYLVIALAKAGVVRMTTNDWIQIVLYFGVLLALTKPLGVYMARVYEGKPCGLDRALGWLERLIYRTSGIDPKREMSWKQYAVAVLLFNFVGLISGVSAIASAACAATQSARVRGQQSRLGVQHSDQLCHQHQLARGTAAKQR